MLVTAVPDDLSVVEFRWFDWSARFSPSRKRYYLFWKHDPLSLPFATAPDLNVARRAFQRERRAEMA